MVLQFNDIYGTDEEDLRSWQGLCRVLNIEPVPEELQECRKVSGIFFMVVRLSWLRFEELRLTIIRKFAGHM